MIDKEDVILLLTNLQDEGLDVKEQLVKTIKSQYVIPEVIMYINQRRQLDLSKFYEKLRKSYNDKKSKLYINIVKELDENNIAEVLTTLAALNLQIILFAKNVDDQESFLKAARLQEINMCMVHYCKTYDIIPSIKLLQLIKADLKVLEESLKNGEKK